MNFTKTILATLLLGSTLTSVAYSDDFARSSNNSFLPKEKSYGTNGKYLGRVMNKCPLKGTWIGIGTTLSVKNKQVEKMNTARVVCYITRTGFISCSGQGGDGEGNFVDVAPYSGYIRQAAPQIFTYHVGAPGDPGYGCALYEIHANNTFTQATGATIADGDCRMSSLYWEHYNFTKISNETDPSKLGDIIEISNQWIKND